ncbi:MAG: class II aldolase/adducin family protein [Acidobacteria bacterium]|nr:class II aldolase/adducin family protein [Acidobacteriota bacterium]
MAESERELRQQICEIGRLMYQKGWVASNDGNISIKLAADRFLCTPTNISKGMMSPGDLIIVDANGNKVEGSRERTSEIMMHMTIYAGRPDVGAVVHAHPPVSTGFAVSGRPLNQAILPEVVVTLGCVPLADYGLPGTPALSETIKPFIPTHDAILLGNHGVVCSGGTVWQGFFRMETVEHVARIALVAELLGGPKLLPRGEVDKLFDARARYGISSHTTMAAGCPITAEDADQSEQITVTRDELIALIEEAVAARTGR